MAGILDNIEHFVVLMLENRSFDHLLGYLKTEIPAVDGIEHDGDFCNLPNPDAAEGGGNLRVGVSSDSTATMPFDPGHEFCDVQQQLFGPGPNQGDCGANPVISTAPMSGFLFCGNSVANQHSQTWQQGPKVMQCFGAGALPYITTLARQFALFNYWYSALPGPTWPNRFFIHAATSGGLVDSPGTDAIVKGFSFQKDTIYHALEDGGKDWRIYHDGLPQTAGIDSIRLAYIDPFTKHFREMDYFEDDISDAILPEYTFIEPAYDTGNNFVNGNSMHPLNDVHLGDALIKRVYEAIRNSQTYWHNTMLIITFDEHGGFYDHVSPPPAQPTGDDTTYANAKHRFDFDRYGIRVPSVVVSAYTQAGTIIGTDYNNAAQRFDHTSVLATVNKRFGLSSLTLRDQNANTLDVALNTPNPREDAPTNLDDVAP